MSDFDLKNSDINDWTMTQFWESDPMQQNQSICRIILYIEWDSKEAIVETQMKTNSTDGKVWNGLASEYTIPEDTDFEVFAEYYKEKVQPIIIEMGNQFESFWNGSNWKGRFLYDDNKGYEMYSKLENSLLDAPKHDLSYFFDIRDTFQRYNEIISYLELYKIDFLKADLDNDKELDNIIDSFDTDNMVLINHDREDYREELKLIQESLKDELEEE